MKPLEGITVLEFSTMITAALASMMLAEQGARVIKVEPTDTGDPMRYIGARKGDISSLFAGCNRGKESIKVDLKSEAGQAVIHEMIPHIDVVIHNFRPGTMETLNLDFKTLERLNSRLIYMAISGFGTEGPLRRAPAYDPSFRHSAAWRRHKALTNRQHSFARFSATRLPVIPPARPSPVRCSPESGQAMAR